MGIDLLTVTQAAAELGVGKATLKPHVREFKDAADRKAIIASGRLPGEKLGRTFGIARGDLDEFKRRRRPRGRPAADVAQYIAADVQIGDFAERWDLSGELLKGASSEALVLPNNKALVSDCDGRNAFPRHSKDVLLALRQGEVSVDLYHDGRENRELVLDSADIILPALLFLTDRATTVGLNILSSWIYGRWCGRASNVKEPIVKAEYLRVDRNDGTIIRHCKIEAPASDARRLLVEESRLFEKPQTRRKKRTGNGRRVEKKRTRAKPDADNNRRRALEARSEAEGLVLEARALLKAGKGDEAHALFRKSLESLREAHLWEPHNRDHIKLLHELGAWIYEHFPRGCQFQVDKGQYVVRCPVLLSHSRLGFSMGGTQRVICSICGLDALACPHLAGDFYDSVIASRHGKYDICNICGSQVPCEHEEGQVYDGVCAFGIVSELQLDHVALVENPRNPLCAINEYSLTRSMVLEDLPEHDRPLFVYGSTTLWCHHCAACTGV